LGNPAFKLQRYKSPQKIRKVKLNGELLSGFIHVKGFFFLHGERPICFEADWAAPES